MKTSDRYLKYVEWSEEDQLYIGYCPDLFPHGGVCHAVTELEAFEELSQIVSQHVADLEADSEPMPPRLTKPSRELVFY
jgi:predicted RNase H-like HicB family nuclease